MGNKLSESLSSRSVSCANEIDSLKSLSTIENVSPVPKTPAEKLERLKTIRPFVLDNSLRETSVAQVRGHTFENKEEIFNAVRSAGLTEVIVASFGDLKRVDDVWLEQKKAEGKIENTFWAFSELWETFDENKVPRMCDPQGLRKTKLYGIHNIIFEISFGDQNVDWLKLEASARGLCEFVRLSFHTVIYILIVFCFCFLLPPVDLTTGKENG
jgi:hypothetical protein